MLKLFIFVLVSITLLNIFGCKKDFSPIYVTNIPDTTKNPYVLTTGGYPDWSPTGDKIAFIRNNDLWVYNLKNWREEKIIENATEPAFSPDGRNIAFQRNKKIYIVDLNTKNVTYLCEGITPSWSDNGKWIAFGHKDASYTLTDATQIYGQPSPDSSLYYYDIENNNIERVVITNYDSLWMGLKLSMFSPDWAQDDSLIIFDTEFGIYKACRNGGRAVGYPENLLNKKIMHDSYSRQPKWNENIQRLAYTIYTDRPDIGDVVTSIELTFITNDSSGAAGIGEGTDVTWSPAGNQICYYSNEKIYVKKWLIQKLIFKF